MTIKPPQNLSSIDALLEIMRALRNPEGGCPWDLEQNFDTIAPYTLEEAYEVADTIERKDFGALKDELGDLLFQVVYHAQMASEDGLFSFEDVVENVCEKMVRRHPHVFGSAEIKTAEGQTHAWEEMKARERAARGEAARPARTLDNLPVALPALVRAIKLQRRAARVGFDWPDTSQVIDKLNEEMLELAEEIRADKNSPKVKEEFGDLLFVYANLARHLGIDAEEALRLANAKFVRRFEYVEDRLGEMNKRPEESNLEEMDSLWNEIRSADKETTT
ncbi:MAG: nucleoside triphosphate pyrophosphohydrolase [Alphaproteobacteria bacterium]|nr:MAG: nucleoside triphosphate pyrophosphohydrolase [Alphaproteobacteria bacterium]